MHSDDHAGYVRMLRAARALLPGLAFLILLFGAAQADQFIPLADGWQTYVNDRFGMQFDYPADVFTPEDPPENGDGQTFTAEDATLEIYAFHNTGRDTPKSLKKRMNGTEGYENVTYSPSGKTWLVLSGFRSDHIFYEKYMFADGVISAFGVDFPKEEKPFFSPVIERIENSFKPGHSD
jgi:hypothetical protein